MRLPHAGEEPLEPLERGRGKSTYVPLAQSQLRLALNRNGQTAGGHLYKRSRRTITLSSAGGNWKGQKNGRDIQTHVPRAHYNGRLAQNDQTLADILTIVKYNKLPVVRQQRIRLQRIALKVKKKPLHFW